MTGTARAVVAYRQDSNIIVKFESTQLAARVFRTASNVIKRYCESGQEFPNGYQGPGWYLIFMKDFYEQE